LPARLSHLAAPAPKRAATFADGRLRMARAYLNAARIEAASAEEEDFAAWAEAEMQRRR